MQLFSTLTDSDLIVQLQAGAVGVIPTDTVYGLACLAHEEAAVKRLYKLKNRDRKPGTIIAANTKQLVQLGISDEVIRRVGHFWPNSVSFILPVSEQFSYVHAGLSSLAVRIPADETLRTLLEKTGPLLTSSANQPGESPATTVAEAQAYFGDAVDFYVDGGALTSRQSSTLVSLDTEGKMKVLRQGSYKIEEGISDDI